MASGDRGYREYCMRRHRVLAAYLCVYTWKAKADYVVISRSNLERLLQLQRFKEERLRWLISGAKPWFQFHSVFYSGQPLASLYLSRKPLNDLPNGSMFNEDRIRLGAERGLCGVFWTHPSDLDETLELKAIHELSDIAVGLSDLSHFEMNEKT
jgi:hypothetical protein